MSQPDPGPWSPRRAVGLFVAAGWIGVVLTAWVVLRLLVVEGADTVERVEVGARLEQLGGLLDVRTRGIAHAVGLAAAEPELQAWLASGAETAPPPVLVDLADGAGFVGVVDERGEWRYSRSDGGPPAVTAATHGVGTRVVQADGGWWAMTSRAVGPARLVVVRPLEGVAALADELGLTLSAHPLGAHAEPTARVEVIGPDRLVASRVLLLPEGDALGLRAESARPGHRAALGTFRALLVGFSLLSGILGLLAMRLLPSVLHRESDRLYSDFVDKSGEGIVLVEPDTLTIFQANAAVSLLLGRASGELCTLTLPEVLPLSPAAVISLRGLIGKANVGLGEVPYSDGARTRHIEITASQMSWRDAFVVCVVLRDVTARHAEAERNRHMAWHDPLTGLPNRAAFQDRLRAAIAHAHQRNELLGVAFVDVDQFKSINDAVGHDVADRLLIDVANRLREGVRGGDAVARQGGDEFLLLLPNLCGREDLGGLGERILAAFRNPFLIDGREFTLTASVGLALYPDDGLDAAELVKHADVAMFQAKEAGRDGWQQYDARLRARSADLAETRARLSHALERQELSLHYQPQVDLRTGQLIGAEALLRWRRDGQMVSPADFIPLAEQTGLIAPIGTWVIREACRQARAWQDAGHAPIRVAVNLSARQFFNGGVTHAVDQALAETGLDPRWLEVEITESLAMKNAEMACRVLEQLRDRGVTVALDDFGTGYSSLAYLRQFPIDRLKLDRAFLAGASADPEQRALVGAIITLAHAIRMEVVAEGIETTDQLELLHSDGCDIGQGFGLSRPLPADDFLALLEDGRPLTARLQVSRVA